MNSKKNSCRGNYMRKYGILLQNIQKALFILNLINFQITLAQAAYNLKECPLRNGGTKYVYTTKDLKNAYPIHMAKWSFVLSMWKNRPNISSTLGGCYKYYVYTQHRVPFLPQWKYVNQFNIHCLQASMNHITK